jgi:tetratricopeptide (TPR) repeat protein
MRGPRREATSPTPSPPNAAHWSARLAPFLLIAACILGVYSQSLQFELLGWDDHYNLSADPRLNPPSLAGTVSFWTQPNLGLYAPLSYTLFAVEAAIWRVPSVAGATGINPRVVHAGSILLHLACAWLVYCIVLRLVAHRAAACCAALLFALHPIQVESVCWATETRGLLAAFFSLATITVYLSTLSIADAIRTRPSYWRHGLIALLFGAALLSKPSATSLPILLIALAVYSHDHRKATRLLIVAMLLMSAALLGVTATLQPAGLIDGLAPWYLRPLVAVDAVAHYLWKLVAPFQLGPDYGWRYDWLSGRWWFYAVWLIPTIVVTMLVRHRAFRPALLGLAILAAALLPTLGLVPFGFQEISTVADRYAYLGVLGLTVAAAALLAKHWSFGAAMTSGVLLAILAGMSHHQANHWKSDSQLLSHMLVVNKRSFVAYTNLGESADRRGQPQSAARYYERALQINPRYALAWYNLGTLRLGTRELVAAKAALLRANELAPDKLETLTNLGRVLIDSGDAASAIPYLEKTVASNPQSPEAHATLGDAYAQTEQFTAAERCLAQALRLRPDFIDALYISADLRRRQGCRQEARDLLVKAVEIQPGFVGALYALGELHAANEQWPQAEAFFTSAMHQAPGLLQAHYRRAYAQIKQGRLAAGRQLLDALLTKHPNYPEPYLGLADAAIQEGNSQAAVVLYQGALKVRPKWSAALTELAWVFATSPDRSVRNPQQALQIVQDQINQDPTANARKLDVLAAAQAASGEFAAARDSAKRAIDLADKVHETLLASRIRDRLDRYQRGESFVDRPSVTAVAELPKQ